MTENEIRGMILDAAAEKNNPIFATRVLTYLRLTGRHFPLRLCASAFKFAKAGCRGVCIKRRDAETRRKEAA